MTRRHLTLCVGLIAALGAANAQAQATAPDPQGDTQTIEIGGEPGKGAVKTGNIIQNQGGGKNSRQHISIGNGKGGSTVIVGNITQNQTGTSGPGGTQQVEIGKGSTTPPQVGDIIQNGSGTQKTVIGNP
ncbi:MAG: hypothetical protein FWF12_08085 [Betaproteobacteria bacterium]|nr:hypothetical protein [Betaproteobacteria bacterium]